MYAITLDFPFFRVVDQTVTVWVFISGHSTDFRQVNIGTTHFVNAAIQRQNLTPVAVLRLCGTASWALEPCIDFPDDLKEVQQ